MIAVKECKQIEILLTAYVSGEAFPGEQARVEAHLQACPRCRTEYQDLLRIFEGIDDLEAESQRVIDTQDWDRAAAEINRQIHRARRSYLTSKEKTVLGWRILAPALAATLFFGIILGYWFFAWLSPSPQPGRAPIVSSGDAEQPIFLNRIESALDRQEALDYLKQTQLVLMDFMRHTEVQESPAEKRPLYIARAKSLLGKKHYFSQNLERSNLAAASVLVEKIQWVLMEMVALEENPSSQEDDQIRRLRGFIEGERLSLKIRLIVKELSGKLNEV